MSGFALVPSFSGLRTTCFFSRRLVVALDFFLSLFTTFTMSVSPWCSPFFCGETRRFAPDSAFLQSRFKPLCSSLQIPIFFFVDPPVQGCAMVSDGEPRHQRRTKRSV